MGIAEGLGWSVRGMESQSSEVSMSPATSSPMFVASPVRCAYNQTRECFLALEVLATELSYINIGDILAKQNFKSTRQFNPSTYSRRS